MHSSHFLVVVPSSWTFYQQNTYTNENPSSRSILSSIFLKTLPTLSRQRMCRKFGNTLRMHMVKGFSLYYSFYFAFFAFVVIKLEEDWNAEEKFSPSPPYRGSSGGGREWVKERSWVKGSSFLCLKFFHDSSQHGNRIELNAQPHNEPLALYNVMNGHSFGCNCVPLWAMILQSAFYSPENLDRFLEWLKDTAISKVQRHWTQLEIECIMRLT